MIFKLFFSKIQKYIFFEKKFDIILLKKNKKLFEKNKFFKKISDF